MKTTPTLESLGWRTFCHESRKRLLPLLCAGREEEPLVLQFFVFRLCLSDDGNIRISFFPENKKILVGFARTLLIATHGLRSSQLQMCERTKNKVHHDTTMFD